MNTAPRPFAPLDPHSALTSSDASPADAATAPAPVGRILGVLVVRPLLILTLGLGLLAAERSLVLANALVVLVDVIALIIVGRAMRAEGRRLRDLFAPWRWVDLAWGALMLVILVVGFLVAIFLANLIVYRGSLPMPPPAPDVPLWVGLVAVLIAPLTIACAEEAVYRGYAQPRLGRRIGSLGALVVVAVVFGLQHVGFALTSGPDVAAKVLTTLLAGLVLGGLWLWMRRLVPLVLAHWGLDLLLLGLPTLLLAVG
ncbi:CPBP family glutamic-type intramembrane protease [Brachybacterium fresconis]|uniref:Membrane protease YdiL (CAAX protease family) n=1 Tax=Brachybacterium fresconis TaxID=173363 RepID=A0ABS4YKX2_9MICO|nr:CPBP family glutamic-type intramembrane protease [Brachybacterium fresconis]MBP2409394.1 membrane protease YdiL (CAAX protease family) [Brachybacterium fresconis]